MRHNGIPLDACLTADAETLLARRDDLLCTFCIAKGVLTFARPTAADSVDADRHRNGRQDTGIKDWSKTTTIRPRAVSRRCSGLIAVLSPFTSTPIHISTLSVKSG